MNFWLKRECYRLTVNKVGFFICDIDMYIKWLKSVSEEFIWCHHILIFYVISAYIYKMKELSCDIVIYINNISQWNVISLYVYIILVSVLRYLYIYTK